MKRQKVYEIKEKGFTLLELVVTIFIITIISALAFVNFRSGENNLALDRAAQKVAQDIRKAAELAIQAEFTNPCNGADTLSGYGVRFVEGSTSYDIYANCNGLGSPGYTSSQDVILETIVLQHSLSIVSLDAVPSSGNFNDTVWTVSFFPPDPAASLCSNDSCTGNNLLTAASVVIGNSNESKTVEVNERGFADVN